jgi:hypothetical protein
MAACDAEQQQQQHVRAHGGFTVVTHLVHCGHTQPDTAGTAAAAEALLPLVLQGKACTEQPEVLRDVLLLLLLLANQVSGWQS